MKNIQKFFNEAVKSGSVKRSIMVPSKNLQDGTIGYIKVIEGGAIHKILLNQGIDPFK